MNTHAHNLRTKARYVKPCLLAACLALAVPSPAPAAELTLRGDRITLRTRNEPLRNVLEAFSAYGVRVEVQTGVDATVDGDLVGVDIDEALDTLLGPFNHVTLWRETPYATGTVRVLDGIRVFRADRGSDPFLPVAAAPRRIVRLADGSRAIADELLIGMRPGVTPEAFRSLLNAVGGHVVSAEPGLGVYRIRLPANSDLPSVLERLRKEAGVGAAEPNFVYELPAPANAAKPAEAAAPPAANKRPAANAGTLAILDSGLAADWSQAAFLQGTFDATGDPSGMGDPVGHGTQMALIGAGLVAPNGARTENDATPILAIRGFDEAGLTTSYAMLESLRYAREQGARVVSMSWGTYTRSAFLDAALTQAADAGMVLLAASGNDGKDTPMYPAAHPNVIAVGAAEADGTAWAQSNGGSHVKLIAYGTATLPVGHNGPPGNYAGTSIATPWVASAVSAWLQRNPNASASDARTALLRSLQTGTNGSPGLFDQSARDRFLGSAKAQ
jgi:thermitase